ncbi:adenylyl-sulfate kinase [Lacipirellula parvula]|uniref:Adenylyl-sulfate kinase n=1 Tax=Lacipirellula parvula TaxID=2650471 RepID=A0A5K7XGE1_9BACT|nr:adenylyl-sulfate kinase [Lacipirellula parvula]BBO35518.1 adenylylsulfate kinase [Lacipirellula parvula]
MNPTDPIVVWHQQAVSRADREQQNGHRGCVVWFTGLSGCGKSTVANVVDHKLYERGVRTYLLDGDNVRHGLNATPAMLAERYGDEFGKRFGLGFGQQDREENIRRVGAVSQLMCDAGLVTLTAFVSPYRADRDAVRAILAPGDFIEIFVDAPLEVCEARDPKGLYKKARAGQIKDFTGIDAPYEPPVEPQLVLKSAEFSPEALAEEVLRYLTEAGKLNIA